ncbi:hypothetical protein [Litchfieldia alkalitelluris]|uniref:hypothetical protein n=1 Tax=Litchfieldia alkalitelluris TaxID=304268 RepID=UPI000997C25E|nr:hypothetical protein [Litchfieldia alkalitelluris]
MKQESIFCEKCSMEIKQKDNLVVTTYFFSLACYHDSCYSKSLKGFHTLFVGNEPINGPYSTFLSVIAVIAALVLLIIGEFFSVIAIVLLLNPAIRLYSWLTIERFLE